MRTPRKNTLLTTAELCSELGVSRGRISQWVSAGLPVAARRKSRHGRPTHLFDSEAVQEWLAYHVQLHNSAWCAATTLPCWENLPADLRLRLELELAEAPRIQDELAALLEADKP
jgi:hypothetical protein